MRRPLDLPAPEFASTLRRLAGEPEWGRADHSAREEIWSSFRDETGARPRAIEPLLAIDLGLRPPRPSVPLTPDEALLWDLVDRSTAPSVTLRGDGPLVCEPEGVAQEMLAETELRALHAYVSSPSADPGRVASAVAWHLEEIQPDNTTTRPWAVHAFWAVGRDTEDQPTRDLCAAHVEMMLHACLVSMGRPDAVSGIILRHAAGVIDPG